MATYCFKRYTVGHKIKHKPKKSKEEIIEVVEEEVEYNDQFVDIANKALNSTIKYKYIVYALIVVAIGIAGTLAFMDSSKKSKSAALSEEFAVALSVFNAEVIPNSEADGQFKTSKEKLTKAIEEFKSFNSAHRDSSLAVISKLYIANSYFGLSDYDNAIKFYDEVIASSKLNDLKEIASLKKAISLKEKKNIDKSIEIFKAIKASENTYIASFSLYTLAEIYKDKKDVKTAKTFLDELNKKYSSSLYALKAKSSIKL